MKYNPKQEILVQQVIKALGEATLEEIEERLSFPPFDKTPDDIRVITKKLLSRIVRRWERKHVITGTVHDGQRMFHLMQIPWLARLDMIHVESVPDEEAKKFLQTLETSAKEISAFASKGPIYGDYVQVEATFETTTPILGGDLSNKERELVFPRDYNGDLYIRPNWLYGYMRDNARLANISNLQKYLTCSAGTFEEQPETFKTKAIRVKEGHVTYEAIPPKSRFTTVMNLPLKGYDGFNSVEAWKKLFKKIEVVPLRGLGSNWKVFGGRIKLVEMKEIA